LGNVTGGSEYEVDSKTGETTINSGNYATVGADGRVSPITIDTQDNGNRTYAAYMVSPSRIYMLDTYTTWAGSGLADLQPASFSNSLLSGNYGLGGAAIGPTGGATTNVGFSLLMHFDGVGSITGIGDVMTISYGVLTNGAPTTVVLPSSVMLAGSFGSVQNNGQSFFNVPASSGCLTSVDVQSLIFFVVSPTESQMLSSYAPPSGCPGLPTLDGTMLLQ
jgi:hypothetical protein